MGLSKAGRLTVAAFILLALRSCASVDEKSAVCQWQRSLEPILSTHTFIPYPPISSRLNEQGVTMMAVTVGNDGVPTDVTVKHTSGSDRLDSAAANYIKAHWRWQPQAKECATATAAVDVAWHISQPPIPKGEIKMQRGVEIMTIYTRHIDQIS